MMVSAFKFFRVPLLPANFSWLPSRLLNQSIASSFSYSGQMYWLSSPPSVRDLLPDLEVKMRDKSHCFDLFMLIICTPSSLLRLTREKLGKNIREQLRASFCVSLMVSWAKKYSLSSFSDSILPSSSRFGLILSVPSHHRLFTFTCMHVHKWIQTRLELDITAVTSVGENQKKEGVCVYLLRQTHVYRIYSSWVIKRTRFIH